jgi:hypothetical protein
MITKTNNDIGVYPPILDSEWESKFKTNNAAVNLTMNPNKVSTTNFVPLVTTSPLPPDAMLDETEHILEDYISLMKANNSVVAHAVAQ